MGRQGTHVGLNDGTALGGACRILAHARFRWVVGEENLGKGRSGWCGEREGLELRVTPVTEHGMQLEDAAARAGSGGLLASYGEADHASGMDRCECRLIWH